MEPDPRELTLHVTNEACGREVAHSQAGVGFGQLLDDQRRLDGLAEAHLDADQHTVEGGRREHVTDEACLMREGRDRPCIKPPLRVLCEEKPGTCPRERSPRLRRHRLVGRRGAGVR